MKQIRRIILLVILAIIIIITLSDEDNVIPVKNATSRDWHQNSFWFYPWGKSGTHKGIDIFAKTGTPVLARTSGMVIFSGNNGSGGKAVVILSHKYRLHYYAHLNSIDTKRFDFLKSGEKIGEVGTSGNAKGKPPHLHYSILRLVPQPFDLDLNSPQGWKKMFYMDPSINL